MFVSQCQWLPSLWAGSPRGAIIDKHSVQHVARTGPPAEEHSSLTTTASSPMCVLSECANEDVQRALLTLAERRLELLKGVPRRCPRPHGRMGRTRRMALVPPHGHLLAGPPPLASTHVPRRRPPASVPGRRPTGPRAPPHADRLGAGAPRAGDGRRLLRAAVRGVPAGAEGEARSVRDAAATARGAVCGPGGRAEGQDHEGGVCAADGVLRGEEGV
ncbi:hypothetical protein BKA56DRAFT_257179 [Ilyonectria sp. MPI-CAGE-AT-0026]|nr:hypothetical protein BKA56DRAFT_257179 [Ilyonectria sp. MPI-CAGE-AT-0026]